jgi:hypothetical protein
MYEMDKIKKEEEMDKCLQFNDTVSSSDCNIGPVWNEDTKEIIFRYVCIGPFPLICDSGDLKSAA